MGQGVRCVVVGGRRGFRGYSVVGVGRKGAVEIRVVVVVEDRGLGRRRVFRRVSEGGGGL